MLQKLANVLDTTTDFPMQGRSDDIVSAQLTDKELLSQFKQVARPSPWIKSLDQGLGPSLWIKSLDQAAGMTAGKTAGMTARMVEKLNKEDKHLIKTFIDAFLIKRQVQQLAH